jgi:signal transduction histidine kinase
MTVVAESRDYPLVREHPLRARVLWIAVLVCGLSVGVYSVGLARSASAYSFAGGSPYASAAELMAGFALLGVGLIALTRPREARLGAILIAASVAWFMLEWNNPGARTAFVFSAGLALYSATPPLVAHAVIAYPDGRIRSRLDLGGLALAYTGAVLVLGLLAAAVFDPAAEGCSQCPHNVLLVHGNGAAYQAIQSAGIWLGAGWSLLLIALIIGALIRSSPARRRVCAPVAVAGCAYLGLVGADFAHGSDRGFLSNDPIDRRLWLGEAVALSALALSVVWSWLRARRRSSDLARLVVEVAESPPPGGLRDALAATLRDPSLELGYRLGDGRLVDAHGRPVPLDGHTTSLVRGGREVALLSHRKGLFSTPGSAEQVAAVAGLALENERLQAEVRAQLEELRASRARIVATGDAERRRMERDLHDGAQQRLVVLLLALRLARSRLGTDGDPALVARIEEAEAEARLAVEELRDLAHGVFPAVLDEAGLAAAIESLAENPAIAMKIMDVPTERFDAAVEAAAYFVVSEAVRQTSPHTLTVSATRRDGCLIVDVQTDAAPAQMVDIEDRVGALDGKVDVARDQNGRVKIHSVIPCAS